MENLQKLSDEFMAKVYRYSENVKKYSHYSTSLPKEDKKPQTQAQRLAQAAWTAITGK